MAEFLEVVCRALGLVAQALATGGAAFALLVLRSKAAPGDAGPAFRRALRLAAVGALVVAGVQAFGAALRIAWLADGGDWRVAVTMTTLFGMASLLRISAGLATALACRSVGRHAANGLARVALAASALIVTASSALGSHAAGRIDGRIPLLALDAIHQTAAAVWVGGLIHLVVALGSPGGRRYARVWLPRFSTMALCSVGALLVGGLGLTRGYVDGPTAFVTTAYGLMVLTKAVLVVGLLAIGAMNFRAVRQRAIGLAHAVEAQVGRRAEIEVALGFVGLMVAASLTSLPPAVDALTGRATVGDVVSRFTPRWPTLTSPTLAEVEAAAGLPGSDRVRSGEDRAWSVYNHNVSGLFVMAMGVVASLAGGARSRWTRHWPLGLTGLAAFVFVRSDPEAWPLGAIGFWPSLTDPEVLQHRLFVAVVVAFSLFEWLVSTGRLSPSRWGLVFPGACIVGAGLLLMHSHAVTDTRALFLMEVSHTVIALLGLLVGVARWLEVRRGASPGGPLTRVWGAALALVGGVLIFYTE